MNLGKTIIFIVLLLMTMFTLSAKDQGRELDTIHANMSKAMTNISNIWEEKYTYTDPFNENFPVANGVNNSVNIISEAWGKTMMTISGIWVTFSYKYFNVEIFKKIPYYIIVMFCIWLLLFAIKPVVLVYFTIKDFTKEYRRENPNEKWTNPVIYLLASLSIVMIIGAVILCIMI